jgi:predicted membrane metal-binding protein
MFIHLLLALVAAVGAGFALILVATIIVIIGVHQEEAAKTAVRGLRPPTICALLARRVLGAHFYLIPGQLPDTEPPEEEEPPWYERPRPPRAR